MPSVNYTTRQPEYNYMLTPGIVNVVYFPLIDINIQVLSQTTPQYPLWGGFAVSIYNYNGTFEMWHAITNSSGYVYVMNVPLNASYILPQGKAYVMLKVRTISQPQTASTHMPRSHMSTGRPIASTHVLWEYQAVTTPIRLVLGGVRLMRTWSYTTSSSQYQ